MILTLHWKVLYVAMKSSTSVLLPSFLLYLLLSAVMSLYNMSVCCSPKRIRLADIKKIHAFFFSPQQQAWKSESRSVKRRLWRIKIASSFGLIKKHKWLSQREKAVLVGPVGNLWCSSQDNTAKSSKQHSMHMGIMTSHKFQKAAWD